MAKQEALRRAFEASGKSVAEFADMYGLVVDDVAGFLVPAQAAA
jgi:ProP effector